MKFKCKCNLHFSQDKTQCTSTELEFKPSKWEDRKEMDILDKKEVSYPLWYSGSKDILKSLLNDIERV